MSQGMINKSGSFTQQTYKYEDEKDHFQFVVHQILLVVSEQYVIIIIMWVSKFWIQNYCRSYGNANLSMVHWRGLNSINDDMPSHA